MKALQHNDFYRVGHTALLSGITAEDMRVQTVVFVDNGEPKVELSLVDAATGMTVRTVLHAGIWEFLNEETSGLLRNAQKLL